MNGFGFIPNDNISKTHLRKDDLEDLGTNILAGYFADFLSMFMLSNFSEHLWLHTDKHLKGLCDILVFLISDNSLSPEIVSDFCNLYSVSSNWNSLIMTKTLLFQD